VAPLSKKGERVGAVLEFRDITEDIIAEKQKIAALEYLYILLLDPQNFLLKLTSQRKAKDEQRRRAQEALEYQKRQVRFFWVVISLHIVVRLTKRSRMYLLTLYVTR